MSQRRRTSKGILVASTNEKKQNLIKLQLNAFKQAYKEYKVIVPLLLTFMQIDILK